MIIDFSVFFANSSLDLVFFSFSAPVFLFRTDKELTVEEKLLEQVSDTENTEKLANIQQTTVFQN